jgi:hypothetical protein
MICRVCGPLLRHLLPLRPRVPRLHCILMLMRRLAVPRLCLPVLLLSSSLGLAYLRWRYALLFRLFLVQPALLWRFRRALSACLVPVCPRPLALLALALLLRSHRTSLAHPLVPLHLSALALPRLGRPLHCRASLPLVRLLRLRPSHAFLASMRRFLPLLPLSRAPRCSASL